MSITVIYGLLIVLMLVGVLGAFLPGLPGTILILAAALIWGGIKGFEPILIPLGIIGLVFLLNLGVDLLATYWGAKRFGASHWGQIGAIVGMILGIFGLLPALPFGGPLLGLLIGPILGACIGEFLYQKKLELIPRLKQSFLASLGIVVGSVVGKVLQGLLALSSVGVFIWFTWSNAIAS